MVVDQSQAIIESVAAAAISRSLIWTAAAQ